MDAIKQRVYKGTDREGTKIRIRQLPPADYRDDVEERIKLHLGSGAQNWSGWINIDKYEGGGSNHPDITGSIIDLPQFDDDSVDEIMLIHVFEHLYTWEALPAVKEWYRILKPGGILTIEVPCLNKILKHYEDGVENPYMTIYGIFGEQCYEEPEMVHKWCYSKKALMRVFQKGGFSRIGVADPVYHLIERDMRVIGVK